MIAGDVDNLAEIDKAQRHRDKMADRSRQRFSAVASIGEIPPVVNPERRARCAASLEQWLVTYYPESTGLRPFSDDHRKMIANIEACCLQGGRYVNTFYRGGAKTTIGENAVQWATFNGHREFVPLFGANKSASDRNIESIKHETQNNELLAEDYPEICHPIILLGGSPQRTHSQHYNGDLTNISWTSDFVVLPTIRLDPREAARLGIPIRPNGFTLGSGAIITAQGITAASRGMRYHRKDGSKPRPDFVIIDDPQTDESARSPGQVENLIGLLNKSILKLAGPRKKLAIVINATVIEADDMIDTMLDKSKFPSWQGERISMVKSWAEKHDTLWLTEYAKRRNSYDPGVEGDQLRAHEDATAYYLANRAEMDAGLVVSWEWCYDEETEKSAGQHAYNVLIDDGQESFDAECQNRPKKKEKEGAVAIVSANTICSRLNGRPQGVVPEWVNHLTAFVDVQGSSLWWTVCGFSGDFTGAIIDYGVYPDQGRAYFTLDDVKRTIQMAHPGLGSEGTIMAALDALTNRLNGRTWQREGGAELRIAKQLVDMGYETEAVVEFCRQSKYAAILTPSKGFGIKAGKKPMNEYESRPGERSGLNWLLAPRPNGKGSLFVKIDTNSWKTFIQARLSTAIGDPGNLTLFGRRERDEHSHRMLADHLTSEYRVTTTGQGRTLDEWNEHVGRDNHWLDGVVGCHVGASMLGCKPSGLIAGPTKKRKLSDLYAARR